MTAATRRRVDHLAHAVHDLDGAASAYEDLGFLVTPQADHPFGTSNRLVVLDRSYIELVAVTRPEQVTGGFADRVRRFLGDGPGLAFLVLGSDYADADHAMLARNGLATGDPFSFSRPATLADGSTTEASFTLVDTPGFPNLGVFLCQHHTPEAVWDPGYRTHPNGATSLTRVVGTGTGAADVRRTLAALTGAEPDPTDDRLVLHLDGSDLVLATEASERGPGPTLTGFTVRGTDGRSARIAGAEVTVQPA